jgi:general stress protein YciG
MVRNENQGNQEGSQVKRTSTRGFASMNPEQQREIARQGGKAAHQKGTAHEFDSEEARAAGRKGGEAVSQNRQHMAEIGRKGGMASGSNRSNRGGNTGSNHSGESNTDEAQQQ